MTAVSLTLLLALGARSAQHRPPPPPAEQAPAASAPTLTDEEVAKRVDTLLGSLDTPISADAWRALGPRAVARLASVASDEGALSTRRAKAIGALSALGGPRAQQVVVATAQSEQAPFAVRASALRGAGQLLEPSALAKAISPVLHDASQAPARAVAAEVLAAHAGSSGCAAVRAQVAREPDHARAQFARALDRCGAAQR
jgi:hypothetical protein